MFSQLPITPEGAKKLREELGLYMPASGRINIAGLNMGDIPRVAEILATAL